jgi:flavin reductase (DIM6/NTAB) family NADH-FMN oxidoreductase RutF
MVYFAEPIQTVLVSCRANVDIIGRDVLKDNLIAVDWHMPVSFNPALYAISVGKARFSCGLISKSRCFVVNFMPYSQLDAVLFCGTNTGRSIDKFKKSGLTKEEGEAVDCPKVAQACAALECEVINSVDSGDHIIFVGRILAAFEKMSAPRLFHDRDDKFVKVV